MSVNELHQMKAVLLVFLFFAGFSYNQTQPAQLFKISTFKNVPDDMMGCGDDCYLWKPDKKKDRLICRTDYANALIYVDGKSVRLIANQKIAHVDKEEIYTSSKYILSLKMTYQKQVGDEDYTFRGIITIKSGTKILYQKKVIGEGGC